MWFVGCIIGELICKESIMEGQEELDQIDKIFEMVGVPTSETWQSFETLPNAKSTTRTTRLAGFPKVPRQ
jgi:cell division cycle 2-like